MQTAIQTITRFYESFNSNYYYYLPKKIQGKSTTSSQAEKKKKKELLPRGRRWSDPSKNICFKEFNRNFWRNFLEEKTKVELRMPLPFLSPAPSLLESLKLKDMNKPLSHSLAKSCFFPFATLRRSCAWTTNKATRESQSCFWIPTPLFHSNSSGIAQCPIVIFFPTLFPCLPGIHKHFSFCD